MFTANNRIYLANFAVDMRMGINGLSLIVLEHFEQNPTDKGRYFVFCNKARNRMKVLYFDKNGFALWLKRLEPAILSEPCILDSIGFIKNTFTLFFSLSCQIKA